MAWIVKLKVFAVALPNVTVTGTPLDVGVSVGGEIPHVVGAPAVHVRATVPLYALTAVTVPSHVTF